jgi:hypothetical protein
MDTADRRIALSALRLVTVGGGKVIISIRHGAGAPTRPVFPEIVKEALKWAEAAGLSIVDEIHTQSVQTGNHQAGVSWTWLVLQA